MKTLRFTILTTAALAVCQTVMAYTIQAPNPADQLLTGVPVPIASGVQTGTAQILDEIAGLGYVLGSELYKADVDETTGSTESGPFASSYETVFANEPTDPADFTISYFSGAYISSDPLYLLVKDGNQDPSWYLYDISDWTGTVDIAGTGFWAEQGAISHVAIYGSNSVPDGGATMLLLGSSMLALGFFGRRRN